MEKNIRDTEDIQDWKVIEEAFREGGEVDRFRRMIMQYQCAMLEVKTKLDVLNAELSLQNRRNPFETIKCRIKSPQSIREKLERNRLSLTIENAERNLNDIAGIRVICSFPDDIYMLADCLLAQDDITLVSKKDYIRNPKPNGYRSLHLEHKLKYKKHIKKAESIANELYYCAELISQLDGRMQQIREKIEEEPDGVKKILSVSEI